MFTNANGRLNPFNRSRQFLLIPGRRARRQATAGSTDEKGNGTITRGCQQLVAEASSAIETIPAAEAIQVLHKEGVVFIDVRDLPELEQDGKIPGAVHASRGSLEFYADPESPAHKDVFASGQKLILYCATGMRSALATQRLQEMGLGRLAHVGGGMNAWKAANGPVEAASVPGAVDR